MRRQWNRQGAARGHHSTGGRRVETKRDQRGSSRRVCMPADARLAAWWSCASASSAELRLRAAAKLWHGGRRKAVLCEVGGRRRLGGLFLLPSKPAAQPAAAAAARCRRLCCSRRYTRKGEGKLQSGTWACMGNAAAECMQAGMHGMWEQTLKTSSGLPLAPAHPPAAASRGGGMAGISMAGGCRLPMLLPLLGLGPGISTMGTAPG
jgi:hypothetical protein